MAEISALQQMKEKFPVIVEQKIAWGEMDAFQHVNNVVYFRYFENSRLEYFARLNWLAANKPLEVGPIVSAVQARFRRPLEFPDTIFIGSRLLSMETDRFILEHQIVSEKKNEITTEGQGTIVTFHYGLNQKVPIPAELKKRIEELEKR